ncbi:M23 family metallopeptidase [Chitinophaga rhizosphaerae]|uniref:M23 family metallopeptidase n=1 Tax=Chitinophaga rhizosphaerae TaxID=1864947 RepID=UPI000F7FC7B3|nr:M23 family metallopeptidase [Chitinophaga rhizosphaerae]
MKLFIAIAVATAPSLFGVNVIFRNAPTNNANSLIRGEVGAYMARRDGGKLHTGIDIVANKSSMDKNTYAVYAVKSGRVAYARLNGTESTDYGYTIVIDHGDSLYSQYSHLAVKASKDLVKIGDEVAAGQIIAYLADPAKGELSSGNVRKDVVKNYDKIQLHFETFMAKPGVTSTGVLSTIKKDCRYLDPTPDLVALGYASF